MKRASSDTRYPLEERGRIFPFDDSVKNVNRVEFTLTSDQPRETPAYTTLPVPWAEIYSETDTEQAGIMNIVEVLNRIYRMSEENDEHNAIDVVFDFMDDNLLAGNFEVCEDTLKQVNINKILPSLIISFLMATRRAKQKLPSRSAFIDAAFNVVAKERGESEAEALLGKYR